jgi:hypothetical protein
MLHAHSLLWHYLWVAPEVFQLGLAIFLYRPGMHKLFPVFFVYCIYEAVESLALYGMDISPWVSAEAWWRALWIGLIIEGFVKFAVAEELIRHLLRSRHSLVRTGNLLFLGVSVVLAMVAAVSAAFTTPANPHWIVGGGLILQQTLYIVQSGLMVFVFLFAAYLKLNWDRPAFGIALGFGLIYCERLAAWAVEAGVKLPDHGVRLDFLNMATYHVCVLIWCYYLLVPQEKAAESAVSLPENNLATWNRELERLLQP